MEKYNIRLANQVYISLDLIYQHKKEYDENSANTFVQGFFDEIKKLSTLPHRGINKANDSKALIYKEHLIIYEITEPKLVKILDVIDPRQHTKSSKYL